MRVAGRICFAWAGWAAIIGFLACSSSSDSTSPDASLHEPVLDGGGEGGEAATPPNGKALCPKGDCNYQTGDGCPSNMTCAPSFVDGVTPRCVAAGPTPFGGDCLDWTECAPGSICANGLCRKLCCGGDWTGCPAGEHCLRKLAVQIDGGVVDTHAYLCFRVNNCEALDPSSCDAIERGTKCQIADATGATACLPEGTGMVGDPCPCRGGFLCVSNGCRRLCKAVPGGGQPICPPTEGTCIHYARDPDGVGECTPI